VTRSADILRCQRLLLCLLTVLRDLLDTLLHERRVRSIGSRATQRISESVLTALGSNALDSSCPVAGFQPQLKILSTMAAISLPPRALEPPSTSSSISSRRSEFSPAAAAMSPYTSSQVFPRSLTFSNCVAELSSVAGSLLNARPPTGVLVSAECVKCNEPFAALFGVRGGVEPVMGACQTARHARQIGKLEP
jgi:hypothetical protein